MSEQGKVLVTGSSGFIGGRIVEVLHLTGALPVRAGIRRWSTCARLGRFPVEIVQFDLLQDAQVQRALEGVSFVVHCAKGSRKETVLGTENLLRASLAHGVKRFVHLSTADVYGEVSGEIDETFPLRPTGTEYSQMKLEAENVCWHFKEKGLPLTVLRPTIVYGPFSRNWTVSIAERLLQGVWGRFVEYGDGLCNLLYVDDLVQAVYLALLRQDAAAEAFNVNGLQVISWNDYFFKFNDMLGLPKLRELKPIHSRLRTTLMAPVRTLGRHMRDHYAVPLKKLASHFPPADALMRRTEKAIKTTPAPEELTLFSRKAHYKCNKAQHKLGYRPKVDIESGLTLSIEWLNHQGFLNRLY